ncbi:ChaN family lipoprotein [Oxalobacteraceae bacterium A2-2]
MKFFARTVALAALAAALAACAGGGRLAPTAAPVLSGHPQVWLLGEVHDNAQGHRKRYDMLKREVEAGWRPVIVMEQFDRENQGLLDQAREGCLDAQCVISTVAGPRWDWQLYYPLLQLALDYKLPLVAGNLSRADASRVVRDGVASAFDPASVKAYGLDQPLPADIRAVQLQEIAAGHCGMPPDFMLAGMVDAQVARDIWMAKLIRAQLPRDVVLIAGNGHVRKDVGVARWLQAVQPAVTVRSEGFVEGGAQDPARYDVTHTLAPQTRPDPCAKFKAK